MPVGRLPPDLRFCGVPAVLPEDVPLRSALADTPVGLDLEYNEISEPLERPGRGVAVFNRDPRFVSLPDFIEPEGNLINTQAGADLGLGTVAEFDLGETLRPSSPPKSVPGEKRTAVVDIQSLIEGLRKGQFSDSELTEQFLVLWEMFGARIDMIEAKGLAISDVVAGLRERHQRIAYYLDIFTKGNRTIFLMQFADLARAIREITAEEPDGTSLQSLSGRVNPAGSSDDQFFMENAPAIDDGITEYWGNVFGQ